MDNPLVSVIIASYNHERYIQKALFSIINQTYKNIQLIVIDDKSTDSTFNKIKELGKVYNFIYEQRNKNQGSGAINANYAAKKYAKGKYLAVCASDDWWAAEKIKKQVDFMEKNPEYAMCYTKCLFCDTDGAIFGEGGKGPIIGFDSLFIPVVKVPASSQFYMTKIFFKLKGYDEQIMVEDWDFLLRCAEKYKIGYIEEPLIFVRKHASNISANTSKLQEANHKIIDKWKHKKNYNVAKKRLYYGQYINSLTRGDTEGFRLVNKLGLAIFCPKAIFGVLIYIFIWIFGKPKLHKQILKFWYRKKNNYELLFEAEQNNIPRNKKTLNPK